MRRAELPDSPFMLIVSRLTHLLEDSKDVRVIQQLRGRKALETATRPAVSGLGAVGATPSKDL